MVEHSRAATDRGEASVDGTGGHASIWDDAVAQSAAIRRGDVSATELLEEYLARIERYDEVLRAYVSVDIDGARRAAHTADALTAQVRPEDLPPFHGVTLSVKDVVDVAGLPTTHSSKVLADSVAIVDGPVVSRFRDAGFVIVGKTNVPEFCTSMTSSELNGTARNPWDPERTPGGSSGGAAASVAAGLCAVAHGTDGAGSVRSPASFCGLVGVKPTRGLVNFGPEVGNPYYGTTVDGVLTRSVRDAASLLDVLLGPRDPATAWSPRPAERYAALALRAPGVLRVAVSTDAPFGTSTPECARAATTTGAVLESLGHQVESATPDWSTILAAAAGPMSVPGAAALVGEDDIELVEPRNRPLVPRCLVSPSSSTRSGSSRCAQRPKRSSPSGVRTTFSSLPPPGSSPRRCPGHPGTRIPKHTWRRSWTSRTSPNRSTSPGNRR